jgi:hypothetical protein
LQAIDKGIEQAVNSNRWNEMGDIVSFLKEQTKRYKQEKCSEAARRHERVQALLQCSKAIRLPFDHDVMFKAHVRKLSGRTAHDDQNVGGDLYILESLLRHFTTFEKGDQLLFCTENSKDYGLEVDKKWTFHPEMGKGLPPVELIKELASLVGFLKAKKTVQEPEPAKVEKALEREKRREAIIANAVGYLTQPRLIRGINSGYSIIDEEGNIVYKISTHELVRLGYLPSSALSNRITRIRQVTLNLVDVNVFGTLEFAKLVKTLLRGLGEIKGPTRFRGTIEEQSRFNISVRSAPDRPLRCWVVRDTLAGDGRIVIEAKANAQVDRMKAEAEHAR